MTETLLERLTADPVRLGGALAALSTQSAAATTAAADLDAALSAVRSAADADARSEAMGQVVDAVERLNGAADAALAVVA